MAIGNLKELLYENYLSDVADSKISSCQREDIFRLHRMINDDCDVAATQMSEFMLEIADKVAGTDRWSFTDLTSISGWVNSCSSNKEGKSWLTDLKVT